MKKYAIDYTVIVEAEDIDDVEMLAANLEGDIKFCNWRVKEVFCDSFIEEVV